MKVTLISSTSNPEDLLIFTKNTRLQMSAEKAKEIEEYSPERKAQELEYMSNTIKSSWEFVNFVFSIEGVSRAFTHQFVRNRQGSYAQQTMRMINVGQFEYIIGPSIEDGEALDVYVDAMEDIRSAYCKLIELGVPEEDARGVLPTNISTNIVAQYNMRTLSDLVASRSSTRTQGEFRSVMELMYQEVIRNHPWAAIFLRDRKVDSANSLTEYLSFLKDSGAQDSKLVTDMIKLVDILRS